MPLVDPVSFPLPPRPFSGEARRVEAGASFDWLRQGWAFFSAWWLFWLVTAASTLLGGLAVLIVPWVGKYVVLLLLPLLLAGGMAACQRISAGERPLARDLFSGFDRQLDGLVTLGALFMVLGFMLRMVISLLPHGSFSGDLILTFVFLLPLILPALMLMAFAPLLVYFHGMAPMAAMRASFMACARNWLPFLVFAMIFQVLAFFALLPVGLGYLLLIPVCLAAHYAAYRDIFPA